MTQYEKAAPKLWMLQKKSTMSILLITPSCVCHLSMQMNLKLLQAVRFLWTTVNMNDTTSNNKSRSISIIKEMMEVPFH